MMRAFFRATWIVALLAALGFVQFAQAQTPLAPSPEWARAMPPGPVAGTRMTVEYVRQIGRMAYFWAWPMMNIEGRLRTFRPLKVHGLSGGVLPVGPVNEVTMLTDYIKPSERAVACPNQDVVYGQVVLDLAKEPVVVQVPDFAGRFFVYQIVDQRTDSFADIGAMYATQPGFYLLAGPDWNGSVPKGIAKVFRSPTNVGFLIPRVFREDTDADLHAVQPLLNQIMSYPLSHYTGRMQTTDWSTMPNLGGGSSGSGEIQWVKPDTFFDELPALLDNLRPLPGEEALDAQIRAVLAAAAHDPKLKEALQQVARDAETQLVTPLFQFHNWGLPLPYNWTTQNNGAAFGVDYFTRIAAAKSNIFVNTPNETKYFYQDLDEAGGRLNSAHRYTVTFAKGATPPVNGFWSLTLYNPHHFFEPNVISRYSVGTKNKGLKYNAEGSLTIYVQAAPPTGDAQANWLPAPKQGDFSLYIRAYWPKVAVTDGSWTPPPVQRVGG
jgi:hypothetical protein